MLTKGPHTAGPIANPSTKIETPTMNTSVLMLNSPMTSLDDSEYADDVKVTAKTDHVTMAVRNHFLRIIRYLIYSIVPKGVGGILTEGPTSSLGFRGRLSGTQPRKDLRASLDRCRRKSSRHC